MGQSLGLMGSVRQSNQVSDLLQSFMRLCEILQCCVEGKSATCLGEIIKYVLSTFIRRWTSVRGAFHTVKNSLIY
jgi:hypothetical protein